MHKKWLILFLSIPSWLFYIVLAAYRVFFLIAFGMFLILVLVINIPFWMMRMIWTWIIGPILALFQFLTDINNFIWGLIFWPFTFVGWLVMLILEILMLIPQWITREVLPLLASRARLLRWLVARAEPISIV